jgi:hypothetical protein
LEPRLAEFGITQRHDAVDKRAARADIAIHMPGRNYIGFADVTIVHPTLGVNTTADYLLAAETKKHKRYELNYHVAPLQILPLAFSTLGIWSKETITNIELVLRQAAGKDNDKYNRLLMRVRFRVAIAIAKGEGAILNWLRYKNRMPLQTAGVAVPPETTEEQSEEEIQLDPTEGYKEKYDENEDSLVSEESAVEEDNEPAEPEEAEGNTRHGAELSADQVLGLHSDEESSQGAVSPSDDDSESSEAEEEGPAEGRSRRRRVVTAIYKQHLQSRSKERKRGR